MAEKAFNDIGRRRRRPQGSSRPLGSAFDLQSILQPAVDYSPESIKACCSLLYQHEWLPLLLGDSFHPGKLALTRHLGEMMDLQPGDRVLDVACGPGTTALFLAETFDVQVWGVDLAADLVEAARQRAVQAGMSDRVRFEVADAEQLPFEEDRFDALLCECAFCTFPDKSRAASEFARVLLPSGRVGISDLTKSGPLPDELASLMAWVACVADARPSAEYAEILRSAGIEIARTENHNRALLELVDEVRGKLLGVELMVKLKKLDLPAEIDFDQIGRLAKLGAEAIRSGRLGYVLMVGNLSDPAGACDS